MNASFKLNGLNKLLIGFVILVHCMFFLLEAILWMMPAVHTTLIELLNNPVHSDVHVQALTLKNLFINQGFYNLFLVGAGIAGLRFIHIGKSAVGLALLLLLCGSATGAGIVLAFSTKAYILAILQALPAAITFVRLYPHFIARSS